MIPAIVWYGLIAVPFVSKIFTGSWNPLAKQMNQVKPGDAYAKRTDWEIVRKAAPADWAALGVTPEQVAKGEGVAVLLIKRRSTGTKSSMSVEGRQVAEDGKTILGSVRWPDPARIALNPGFSEQEKATIKAIEQKDWTPFENTPVMFKIEDILTIMD